MTDTEILEWVTDFRAGILNGRPSRMMCAMVCYPLVTLLNMHGVHCETVETDLGEMNHVWLRLADGRALDPTADQFNEFGFEPKMPPVYLGPPTKYHAPPTAMLGKDRG